LQKWALANRKNLSGLAIVRPTGLNALMKTPRGPQQVDDSSVVTGLRLNSIAFLISRGP
jgi:hypothetical protein